MKGKDLIFCMFVCSTHGYKSCYTKLVLLELALYDLSVQSTVSLFWFCIALNFFNYKNLRYKLSVSNLGLCPALG